MEKEELTEMLNKLSRIDSFYHACQEYVPLPWHEVISVIREIRKNSKENTLTQEHLTAGRRVLRKIEDHRADFEAALEGIKAHIEKRLEDFFKKAEENPGWARAHGQDVERSLQARYERKQELELFLGIETSADNLERLRTWNQETRTSVNARRQAVKQMILERLQDLGENPTETEVEKHFHQAVLFADVYLQEDKMETLFKMKENRTCFRVPKIFENDPIWVDQLKFGTKRKDISQVSEKEIETAATLYGSGPYRDIEAAFMAAKVLESSTDTQ